MTDVLQAIMDAQMAIHKAQEALERAEITPIRYRIGQNENFNCTCGTPLNYGDKYCRECGRRVRW